MTPIITTSANSVELDYPMSVGRYESYADAQRVVDRLADRGFPVENVTIVGTGLRTVERVTGRLTRGKIAAAGAASGAWIGLFVAAALALVSRSDHHPYLIITPVLGALFGLVWSQVTYRLTTRGGTRDFSSVSQVVAGEYEVLVEHKHAADAHAILASPVG